MVSTQKEGNYKLPHQDPIVQYKDFDGWYKTTEYKEQDKVTSSTPFDENHTTIYAKLKDQTVNVTYDANGGKFTKDDTDTHTEENLVVGSTYSISDDYKTPVKAYKEFDGWYTDSQYGEKVTIDETTIENNQPHTLYAHWADKYSKITFDPNGGQFPGGSSDPITINDELQGGFYTFPAQPSLTNKRFTGWYVDPEDPTTKIVPDETLVPEEDQTVKAGWGDPESVDIVFNAMEGSWATSKTTTLPLNVGDYYQFPATNPQRYGYNFVEKWYDQTGAEVKTTDLITETSPRYLYALWTPKTFTLTFNANGGNWDGQETTTVEQTFGTPYVLPAQPTPSSE